MSRLFSATIIVAFSLTGSSLAAAKRKPYSVMPDVAVGQINSRLCSREAVSNINGAWNPSAAIVGRIEKELKQISKLTVNAGVAGMNIEHPKSYFRQYFGITVDGHQLVYLNAFAERNGDPPAIWREQLVSICDGGLSSWGVLYDPATAKFLDLRTNGTGPPSLSK